MHAPEFKLKPSRVYLVFLSIFIIASLGVILTLTWRWQIKSLLFIAVAVYGVQLIWCYGLLRGRDAIIALRPLPEKGWMVTTTRQRYEATLCGDSLVTHLVSVLRFRVAGRYFPLNCTLLRDSLGPDEYRQLVVLAKHQ